MKKFFSVLLSMCSLAVFSQDNLLKNPSFEDWGRSYDRNVNLPEHWLTHGKPLSSAMFKQDNEEKSDGKASIRWTNSTQNMVFQTVKISAGKIYQFSCMVKYNLLLHHINFTFAWLDSKGKSLRFDMKLISAGAKNWDKYTIDNLVAPPDAVSVRVGVGAYTVNQKQSTIRGDIWIDDVCFREENKESADKHLVHATIPISAVSTIKIDGIPDEPEWNISALIDSFTEPQTNMVTANTSVIRTFTDGQNLYFFGQLKNGKMSSNKVNPEDRRDNITMNSDIFELFFQPENAKEEIRQHYHFMFDAAGTRYDAIEKYRKNPDTHGRMVEFNTEWDPEYELKTVVNDDGWCFEMKIPLKILGVDQLDKSIVWKANFARGIYNQKELQSWSPLAERIFQDSRNWGEISFADSPVLIERSSIQGGSLSLLLGNPNNKPRNISVNIDAVTNAKVLPLKSKNMDLSAKSSGNIVSFNVPAHDNLYWITVSENNEVIQRAAIKAHSLYAAVDWYDKQNVRNGKLMLAVDKGMRSFSYMMINNNFPETPKGGANRLARNIRPVDIIFDFPEGVEAVAYDYSGWGAAYEMVKPIKGRSSQKNGRKYQEYVFELPFISNNAFCNMVFFSTSWNEGEKGKGYVFARWKDGEQIPRELNLEAVKIGVMPPFKRTISRWDGMSVQFARMWLDNPIKMMPYYGINTFILSGRDLSTQYYANNRNKSLKSEYDEFVPAWIKNGGWIAIQQDVNPKLWRWLGDKTGDPEAFYLDIDGNKVRGQFGPTVCTAYRGKWWKLWINELLNSTAVKDYNCSWLILDMEFWPQADDGCFCARCMQMYSNWVKLKEKKDFEDPKVFMREKVNQAAVAQWMEFKEERFHSWFSDIRKDFRAGLKNNDFSTNPLKKVMISEWRAPGEHLLGSIDIFDTPLYTDRQLSKTKFDNYLKFTGNNFDGMGAALCPVPCIAQNIELNPENYFIWNIFECAVAKVRAYEMWTTEIMTTYDLKYYVDALRTIVPFENIYLDGTITYSVPCEGKNVSARAVVNKDESLLYVRDYMLTKPETVKVEVNTPVAADIFDLRSGKKLGTVAAGKSMFAVSLDVRNPGRMLYVGNHYASRMDESSKRIQTIINSSNKLVRK